MLVATAAGRQLRSTSMKPLALALLFVCAVAQAQTYPDRPIRLVVPFAAGGSGDIVGRTVGGALTQAWGQQVLIDNRPGAAGTIGAGVVARAAADGYTLLLADSSPVSITPHIQKSLPFDPRKDLVPILPIARVEFLITVHPSVAAEDLKGLVGLLKANPGKFSYASAGIGSIHHLSMEWFKQLAGVDITHVPYKGSGQILPDVIAGQVPITYTGLAQTMPHVRAGKLRAIALGGVDRLPAAPGLPTIAESYPGFDGTTSWNLFAPAGTPREITARLNAEVNRIVRDPKVAEQLTAGGLIPLGGTEAGFAARMRDDYQHWGKLIATIGLKAE